jgi:N6-adenosine-specific RNA methylase IME4
VHHYRAILVDPPWPFKTRSCKGKGRSAEAYYDTMSLADIKALPVGDFAARDCALLLWVNTPLLDRMSEVMRAWGFTYKSTGFVWVKCNKDGASFTRLGQGYGARKQSEQCWLGTRGRPKCRSRAVREVIIAPRRAPHQKPDEQYCRIEQLFAGPYLEMFARQRWPGWDAWGNEVDTGIGQRRWASNSYPEADGARS